MTHESAQQRYRRHKRDPLRDQVLAPTYDIPPVRCGACPHARLMHAMPVSGLHDVVLPTAADGRCLSYGCGCTEYQEA